MEMINYQNQTLSLDYMQLILREIRRNSKGNALQLIDSLSESQITSKLHLIQMLEDYDILDENMSVAVLGCWFNSVFGAALSSRVRKITGYDKDNDAVNVGREIFKHTKNVEFVTADLRNDHTSDKIPDLIINTSCEHMPPLKDLPLFKNAPAGVYTAFQSNNMTDIIDHTNCVFSLDEFKSQLPQNLQIIMANEHNIPNKPYVRYTIIGITI